MTDEDQVRRLLAEARHDEPMPDDVAARLDGVIADLREDKAPTAPVDHAALLRRRRVRSWVLAAAAVVVVGIGINQVDWSGMSMGGADGSGDSSAAEADAGSVPSTALESAPESPADDDAARARGELQWREARARLGRDDLARQAIALRATLPGVTLSSATAEAQEEYDSDGTDSGGLSYDVRCEFAPTGPGRVVSVTYDGDRGWLVYRAPQGESQVVDLYLCGRSKPTRSITLPAP
ncbi:hypothetical protein [Nocardioides sp. SR21]|uniref:hypothetical protein n=1 Tax=Nocardioides sp. SR21 TaxID=2919501 RepID=UPI001FAA980F|nr:hypothetical protein [Nocardioides sp. SR21]